MESNLTAKVSKRKHGETSPDLTLSDVMQAISDMKAVFETKLVEVATKSDIAELRSDVTQQLISLQEENQALKAEVERLKKERAADSKEMHMLAVENKRRNVVFTGIAKTESTNDAVMQICTENLGLRGIKVRDSRTIFEKNDKIGVIAEMETYDIATEVFKNSAKLAGTNIYIERDLTLRKKENKRVLLQLKKEILAKRADYSVKIINDSMFIEGKRFYFNENGILMHKKEKANEILKKMFPNCYENIDFDYDNLVKKMKAKN